MAFVEDFKKFILRGNVIDMAVGIIVGSAFTVVVNSLVKDVIMPPIGYVVGRVDFSNLKIVLKAAVPDPADATKSLPAVTINYGAFITYVISFLIVAFVTFLLIKMISAFEKTLDARAGKTPPPPGEPTEKSCPECLSTIPVKATRCSHCAQPVK